MSGEIWFYHLEQSGPEQVLPELVEKSLSRGWKALISSPSSERLASLDNMLWTYRDESFLPHGLASEPDAEKQPVLLSETQDNLNAASVLFLLDGAGPDSPEAFERCILLFDGADETSLMKARSLWKEASASGRSVSYWRQSPDGRWEKKA
jgi:DNA polymerase-3 subunit chi